MKEQEEMRKEESINVSVLAYITIANINITTTLFRKASSDGRVVKASD